MRENKFRAWDTANNKWQFVTLFHSDTLHPMTDTNSLGQFTGLKDKNGKEIYEGDVVRVCNKYPDEDGETCSLGVVEMRGHSWEFINGINFINYGSLSNYEIIGNIYENSDLLK